MRCNIPSRDLYQKLNGTICTYDKQPVWVQVSERGNVAISDLPQRGNLREIQATDPLFDISSPPLGYCQIDDRVYYLSRAPVRRSRQGLDERSLIRHSLPMGVPVGKRVPERNNIIFTKGFSNCLKGEYPPLEDAIKMIRGKNKSKLGNYEVAISRNIALCIDEVEVIRVFYKNDLVGYIGPNSLTVRVPSSEKAWVVSRYLSHVLGWEID